MSRFIQPCALRLTITAETAFIATEALSQMKTKYLFPLFLASLIISSVACSSANTADSGTTPIIADAAAEEDAGGDGRDAEADPDAEEVIDGGVNCSPECGTGEPCVGDDDCFEELICQADQTCGVPEGFCRSDDDCRPLDTGTICDEVAERCVPYGCASPTDTAAGCAQCVLDQQAIICSWERAQFFECRNEGRCAEVCRPGYVCLGDPGCCDRCLEAETGCGYEKFAKEYCEAQVTPATRECCPESCGLPPGPGVCHNRVPDCGPNEYCCGEFDSPYQNAGNCLTVTTTSSEQATLGQCFEMPVEQGPWCRTCDASTACASNYMPGYNTEPNINNGQPFAEQEWCVPVSDTQSLCSVTCDPEATDSTCPAGWSCQAFFYPCFSEFDCNGLTCVGADTSTTSPRPGKCLCGVAGQEFANCSVANGILPVIINYPRCRAIVPGEELYCMASYNCLPPVVEVQENGTTNYPVGCLP